MSELLDRWPSYAWAFNIPELKPLFEDTSIETGEELLARMQETTWWKTTAPSIRNWHARKQSDPEGANQDRRMKEADIWDLYLQIGLNPNPTAVRDLAEQALAGAWTQNQLRDAVVGQMTYSPEMTRQIGNVQSTMDAFKQQAAANYVTLDDKTAFEWARGVAAGEHQAEDYNTVIRTWAKSRFDYSPEIQQALDMGMTVDAYMAPTKQQIGQILEVDPNGIDLANDPKWSQVLGVTDDKGNRRVMTISETQRFARSQDEFKQTRQGQEMAAQAADGLLKMFGKVAR